MKSAKTKHHKASGLSLPEVTSSTLSQLGLELDGLALVVAPTKQAAGTAGSSQVISVPYVFSKMSPATPTIVYETYWRFAAERQEIFFRRLNGFNEPWTSDSILQTFKFTNAYRASDRVSQFLLRHVIYRPDLPNGPAELFFRIMLFKLFNKIETWELLEAAFGALTLRDFSFDRYDRVLTDALQQGRRIYSAAYIMPPGGGAFGHRFKHQNHLKLLLMMLDQRVPEALQEMRRMQDGFALLRDFPTIGDFLAYQFITDINYSTLTNFTEREFVVPGPGARDGLRKCFSSFGGLTEAEIIRLVADSQASEFERLGLEFKSLWGRPLQLIDCQNLFCETDKYARVAHPDIKGITGRSRIKQQFSPTDKADPPTYPPKWNLLVPDYPEKSQKQGRLL